MLLSRTDEGNACNLAFYAPFSGADAPPALPEPPPESSDRDFANLFFIWCAYTGGGGRFLPRKRCSISSEIARGWLYSDNGVFVKYELDARPSLLADLFDASGPWRRGMRRCSRREYKPDVVHHPRPSIQTSADILVRKTANCGFQLISTLSKYVGERKFGFRLANSGSFIPEILPDRPWHPLMMTLG
ncbi:hypothetical protein GEV33_008068 [Tenebrio molitor]|uniref:Uncharacterized protein n=1 Tax=Tenebrio molitor TaxID=7067 RepID=A0A8J6HHC2_TENMO|nr:hypothetical protein GEV33_008068 [Tenebrio molitor]